MHHPLIAIDVGNSRIKIGLFDLDDIRAAHAPLPECRRFAVVRAWENLPAEEMDAWFADRIQAAPAIVTGSDPARIETLCAQWNLQHVVRPVPLADRSIIPLEMDVEFPERVGIDRILNTLAANRLRPEGHGAIIVDSGTATTVELVDEKGTFRGGAILPGLALSARALHEYTELLPEIPLSELETQSLGPVGRETREAIRSGLFWGHLGAIREFVLQFSSLVPDPMKLISGGGGPLLAPHLPDFAEHPHLALQGFSLLAPKLLESPAESE